MALLYAEPLKWYSSGVRISTSDQDLTALEITAFRSRGSFQLEGEGFTVEPEGFFQTAAVLKKGAAILARAQKPSIFRRRFEITSAGHRMVLECRRWTGRDYVLLLGSREVGRIQRVGFAGRRLRMEFPDDVPLFILVFLTYLVAVQARREAAAAAGS